MRRRAVSLAFLCVLLVFVAISRKYIWLYATRKLEPRASANT